MPITIFAIRGNHEQRPCAIAGYREKTWWGTVYLKPQYPNLLFAKDGEVFISGVDQSRIDKSTKIWLDRIEDKLTYGKWYCGHYHTEKKLTSWKLCLKILMSSVDGREIRTSLNALSVGV